MAKSFSWQYDASDVLTFSNATDVQRDRWGIAWQYGETQTGLYSRSWMPIPSPSELPPTTADLSTELAAYKHFAASITASFADTVKRNHQLDYQAAYDELRRAGFQVKGSEA